MTKSEKTYIYNGKMDHFIYNIFLIMLNVNPLHFHTIISFFNTGKREDSCLLQGIVLFQ